MNDMQQRIKHLAGNLDATLAAVVPADASDPTVVQARTALAALAELSGKIPTATPSVWTFCGHWDADTIVIDYVLPGQVQDDRDDDNGEYPEGLWADSGQGATVEEARANALAAYLDNDDE